MKLFKADYNWIPKHNTYGGYWREYYVVVAENAAHALQLAKEKIEGSTNEEWEITELDTNVAKAHYITVQEG